jgi:hypothetical protein
MLEGRGFLVDSLHGLGVQVCHKARLGGCLTQSRRAAAHVSGLPRRREGGLLFSTTSRATTSGPGFMVERRVGVIRLNDVKESQP